jgi:type VI secretion system protein VasD
MARRATVVRKCRGGPRAVRDNIAERRGNRRCEGSSYRIATVLQQPLGRYLADSATAQSPPRNIHFDRYGLLLIHSTFDVPVYFGDERTLMNNATMNVGIESGGNGFDPRRRRLLLTGLGLTLVGCASGPKPTEPTNLIITVQASADVNPDIRGRASPLSVRLFELKSAATFQAADFFALYDRDQATLGADMVGREEMILKPGDTQTVTRKANMETRFLGIIAAYRDLERSVWRTGTPVAPPAEGNRVTGANSRDQRIAIICERTSVRIG